MKLLFCLECYDVRKIESKVVFCKCHKATGCYESAKSHIATVTGPALVLAIAQSDLRMSLENIAEQTRPAVVITRMMVLPVPCKTVRRVE